MGRRNSFVRKKNKLNLKSGHTRDKILKRTLQIFSSSLSNKSGIQIHRSHQISMSKKKKNARQIKQPRIRLTTELFNKSTPRDKRPRFKKIIHPTGEKYVRAYLKFYKIGGNFPLVLSNNPRLLSHPQRPTINKRVQAKIQKNAREEPSIIAGILVSGGLDSTVLKEKILANRKELNIKLLYCFFFKKGNNKSKPTNESNQADREQKAIKDMKEFQKKDENSKFVRIIEIDAVPMQPSENLFSDKDTRSPANHNQWMILQAIAHSVKSNFFLNKFYFDIDCAKNDCFTDTEPAYLAIQPFIDHMTQGATKLERYPCVEDVGGNYFLEKRLKIDYLKELGLWNKISFCYASEWYVMILLHFTLHFFFFLSFLFSIILIN